MGGMQLIYVKLILIHSLYLVLNKSSIKYCLQKLKKTYSQQLNHFVAILKTFFVLGLNLLQLFKNQREVFREDNKKEL